jgi:hypothetical protein
MERRDDGGRDLGLQRTETRAYGHVSARPIRALYVIRASAKESVKRYRLLLTRSGAIREFTNLKRFNKRAKWFHKMISCFSESRPYQAHPKFKTKGRHIKFMHTSHGNPVVTATDMWAKLNIYTTKYSSSSPSTSTTTTNYLSERPSPFQLPPSQPPPSSRN